jgi:diadenosine tetraphosphate (Ap4A) HIT family hydrolase
MGDPNNPCLFCTPRGVTRENEFAYTTRDSYPVSPGHSLVIPRRHCASLFELTPDEAKGCFELLLLERQTLEEDFGPDGYNVGVNIGRAGGQTVMHVHWHVIPRYLGDHPHPQGGVRQIIPEKADYPRATTF